MLKRAFDILFAAGLLLAISPVMAWALWRVWRFDGQDPIYRAPRVGRGGSDFAMMKIRSMSVGADRSGLASTSNTDARITPVGHFIRRYKLDELSQLWNVLRGEMSVVGPRPQIREGGVDRYTPAEMHLLDVRPGITDLSSIVFSDEGAILSEWDDADAAYERLIRPWKSRLGLFYVANRTLAMDVRLIWLTAVGIVSRPRALAGVERILKRHGAGDALIRVARRDAPLEPALPPTMAREAT
tara:strand:- start:379 stop:1104 length:726 start_codon:yes stop_codon:yes gene_type:complete